jgi:hypothetical protein
MDRRPLHDAIQQGLVSTNNDIDVPQSFVDKLIQNSEYAICPNCNFIMIPEKK